MKLVGHPKAVKEIVDVKKIEDTGIDSGLEEPVFVLGQAHVIKPPAVSSKKHSLNFRAHFVPGKKSGFLFFLFQLID